MRNRNIAIRLWLNERERDTLKASAKKAGLPISAYLRFLIMGFVPRPLPPADFWALYKELNAIGNRLNQIAASASATGTRDAPDYLSAAKDLREITLKIYDAVRMPDEMF
jgi:hypothetical protein